MYANQYPSLYKAFHFDNFEEIAGTIEQYFSGLFDLQVIENEIKLNNNAGSYVNFFARIMEQLAASSSNDLYTNEQICNKIYSIIQQDVSVRNCFLKQLIFVPPINQQTSTQLGFQEKLATGKLKVAEPVTYLDMLRITLFLEQLHHYNKNSTVDVIHLASATPSILAEIKAAKRALMINLNLNPKATPKWAVIDLRNLNNLQIYCETPLLASERDQLERKLGSTFTDVSPGKVDSLASTGYSAIAWLDQHITKGWNFDTDADFNVLFGDFALTVFRTDASGVHFSCVNDEYDRYFTDELKYINNTRFGPIQDPASGSKLWGSFSLFRMMGFATLDEIEGEPIPYNDLAAVVHVVGQKRLNHQQFEQYSNLGFRSKIPRFAHTLSKFGRPPVLQEDATQVTLTVPNTINYYMLNHEHMNACAATRTDFGLFRFIKRDPLSTLHESPEEDMATAMVLTLFRARAKRPVLHITLPNRFNLNAAELRQIVKLMQENAFVTELHINEDNQSLVVLKEELTPILARNRWLAANRYLPPMVDNYWQRAAKYWLIYLNEHDDILLAKQEHQLFKQCVEEMSIKGLQAVLRHLCDPELRDRILSIYGKNQPAFYLAFPPKEAASCLEALIDHLAAKQPFPFAELGVAYQPGSSDQYLRLLNYVNSGQTFEKVQLTDCLRHKGEFSIFLNALIKEARLQRWTGLVVIPELEDETALGEEYQVLRSLYRQLNNVILFNSHLKLGEELAARIKEASQFDHLEPQQGDANAEMDDDSIDDLADVLEVHFGESNGPWPMKRGGAVQLQLQQQQEIQQTRQIQQERQTMQMQMLEEVITSDLVTHVTIDALLGDYYRVYSSENECDANRYSPLWDKTRESILQGFFHTWINANPQVKAPLTIRAMTQEAAKMLLRHHKRVTSGLHLANLPHGFYTQRAKEGGLVLCYNPEVGFANGFNTPLTPMMQVSTPKAGPWEGDFRLFNIEHYLEHPAKFECAIDFENPVLFEKLQPESNYLPDYMAFCDQHPDLQDNLIPHKNKILNHWLVFLQAWECQGEQGIKAFIDVDEGALTLQVSLACDILFRHQSAELREWIKQTDLDEKTLRAIAQVYYRYGDESVGLLLTKFKQIELILGSDFFKAFNQPILGRSENYNSYLHPEFFKAIDDMMAQLRPTSAAANRKAWLTFCQKHLATVLWEAPEKMWRAFEYFLKEMADMGLQLSGTEFDDINPQNMVVCLDRLLATLRCLPEQDEKINFLHQLGQHDLTLGGVHYAIQHERFKYSNHDLLLSNFSQGTPTYAPDLAKLFEWEASEATLNIKRTLASHTQFNREDYLYLSTELTTGDEQSRHYLLWLLFTQFERVDLPNILATIRRLPEQLVKNISKHLHQAVFRYGHSALAVSINALDHFQDALQQPRCQALLQRYPHGNFLEAISILADSEHQDNLGQMLTLFETSPAIDNEYPEFLHQAAYKLATLFGAFAPNQLAEFINSTSHLKLAVQHELSRLLQHLFSVNFRASDKVALYSPRNWTELLGGIQAMNDRPTERAAIRKAYIAQLCDRGIVFKYSKTGEFRYLTDSDYPTSLDMFTDHQQRLWSFLKNHIVVPAQGDAHEALRPLLAFFQRLQLNRTYLNEVEPLLAILEKTPIDQAWSAHYFAQMLDALKPDNDQEAFPLDMLQVMLTDEGLKAKPIDNVETDLPNTLVAPLKGILRNTIFSRPQQAKLCELALKEFHFSKSNLLLNEIINLLSPPYRNASRDYSLEFLSASPTLATLGHNIDNLRQLLTHPTESVEVSAQWDNTVALWLKSIAARPSELTLLNQIMASCDDNEANKRALILHIIAWSSLRPGLRDQETYLNELSTQAPKLATRLLKLSITELTTVVACYPGQPSPGTDDLLRILKRAQAKDFTSALDAFLKNPHPDVRADYLTVVKTRQADLQRMLTETRVTNGKESEPLSPTQVGRISLIFAELKRFETGQQFVEGSHKAVTEMSQQELADAFKFLSIQSLKCPNDDSLQAQIWALLFEALGRTTRKYPHMAQQVALIANDIAVDAKTRVLRLSTGEGKSHFVALRAARHAALGNVVDVCTAKRSLASRDLEVYKDLFNYLGFTASCIQPKSSRGSYTDTQIHYSTLGDLSLFLDEQRFNGKPINIDPKKRVGLLDELDFIYFDEGRKTEYNYARPSGRTPKHMSWFYQAINEFYLGLPVHEVDITQEVIRELATFLKLKAGDNEEKQSLVSQLVRDGLQLVNWLQSAYEAHQLEKGIGFTILEENIQVGDAIYLVKEIIPLSSDNQRMAGSTFSSGVHQLLAVRLNSEAKAQGETQNYHVHAESHIISSQVAARHMRTLWEHWEGFTGTISAAQAQSLNREQGTQVLQVSTNQRDLRNWHAPTFFPDGKRRLHALILQLRQCMEKNQSILFSCKNDQQVLVLKEQLQQELSPAELAYIIFYTNEDRESSQEILNKKQLMENWQAGEKQHAVGLVASGFGRGDNVGVGAVFLFDVNDINDLQQKGGRTARNGDEGEVFQFYLNDEMAAEETRLLNLIAVTPGVEMGALTETLATVNGSSEPEKCFHRLMLLREYVFTMQNSANQGYHAAIAQLSGFGMELIGNIDDPTQRYDLTSNLTLTMHRLEKEWLTISSHPQLTPTEKVRAVEAVTKLSADDLLHAYKELVKEQVSHGHEFKLEIYPDIILTLAKAPTESTTQRGRDLAILGSILASLSSETLDHSLLSLIPEQFNILAQEPNVLHGFTREAIQIHSLQEFINQLAIRVEQIRDPSVAHQQAKNSALEKPDETNLFVNVPSHDKASFMNKMGKLTKQLQDRITDWQKQLGFSNATARVEQLLPLITYLGTFSQQEQLLWGNEYLQHLEYMWISMPSLLSQRLCGRPMSYTDSECLWQIANGAGSDQAASTFKLLQDSIKGDAPTQRLRMQTRCESLMHQLPSGEKIAFLIAFNKVMAQFHEGKNWATFVKLVEKTSKGWNIGEEGCRTELQRLWSRLSEINNLSEMTALLEVSLAESGVLWFQTLLFTCKTIPPTILRKLQKEQWQLMPQFNKLDPLGIKFSTEARQESLKGFERLLSDWDKKGDIIEKLNSILPNYRKFLHILAEKEATAFNAGASWYFEFIQHHPMARTQLDRLVAQPERQLTLSKLMSELTTQRLNDLEASCLLQLAIDNHPTDAVFSECCQGLVNLNELLTQTPLLTVEEKQNIHQRLLQLSSDKLLAILPVFLKHQGELKANPRALNMILTYGEDISLNATRVARLAAALLQILSTETKTPQMLHHLNLGVSRFKQVGFSDGDLDQLLLLLQGQDALAKEQGLFDNIAHYLNTEVHPGKHQKVKQVMDWFYPIAKKHRGETQLMKNDAILAKWFDFSKESELSRNQRVIWMHMLNHGAFITGENHQADLDNHAFQWVTKDNQAMLQQGLDLYIAETKKLLTHKPTAKVSRDRDLNIAQQRGLLRLADELAVIGTPQLKLTSLSSSKQRQANLQDMKTSLGKLVGNYQSTWFKSSSRKSQFEELHQQVIRQVDDSTDESLSRYEQVITAIRRARMKAMKQDIIDNQPRYFMLNRSGHSRYFSTLNQMEDMVVRCWVQDMNAVESFQNYKKICQTELLELSQELNATLQAYHVNTFAKAQENLTTTERMSRWFASKNQPVIEDILHQLVRFNETHVAQNEPLTDIALEALTKELHQHLSHLPGHVQTLAKEVLMRSNALITHLSETHAHPTKEILATMGG